MSTVVKDLGAVSAYAYAVEKGYTGTEAEFAELMASYADVGQTAVDAKDAAVAAKTAAQTAATTATNKASEATTAATTATTKAGEASQNASQAQASAQTASTKASEASASASTATTKATEATTAAGTATTAKDDAVTAKTAAETAQGKAETAQGKAEDAAESVSASAAQIVTNTSDITDLKSGLTTLESDGVVPSAEQLLSKNMTADVVPYLFRRTGGDGADREYVDAIVGGSVVWNQLADLANVRADSQVASDKGISYTKNTDGSFTLSGTANATGNADFYFTLNEYASVVSGHRYITGNETRLYTNVSETGKVYTATATGFAKAWIRIAVTQGTTYNIKVYPQVFDLTAMFGSTIADYIYSLEQSTAGAGVAWFRKLFPNDYYEYDAGTLKSVEGVSAHEMVGFNQWDEEWETGGYNSDTGKPESVATRIRSKNYIPVISGQSYFFSYQSGTINSTGLVWILYDADKNYISGRWMSSSLFPFTIPDGCAYVRFNTGDVYGGVYKNDICINLSWSGTHNGEYEPYTKHSYALDNSLTLRGIPKLVDGKIKWDGDVYASDGTVKRRYGIVDLGSLDWTYVQGNISNFRSTTSLVNAKLPQNSNAPVDAICSRYTATSYYVMTITDKTFSIIFSSSSVAGHVWISDNSYTDAATFKTAMSGVYLVYELATPTTESADPYQHLQQCDPNGTEEFVSTGIVPVGHNTKYPDNLRMKLDNLPWNFASLIAPTESAFVATRNYTTGNLLIVNNVLYKATANIANGGTITVGTNVTATTLAEVISALS